MIIGTGSLILVLLLAISTVVSILWKQRLALWLAGAGVTILLYLVASVVFQISFPYQTWNISIYVVFFVAMILCLSGGTGVVVKLIQRKKKVNNCLHGTG